jgi:hypothetical protein
MGGLHSEGKSTPPDTEAGTGDHRPPGNNRDCWNVRERSKQHKTLINKSKNRQKSGHGFRAKSEKQEITAAGQ